MKIGSLPGHWTDAVSNGRYFLRWRRAMADKLALLSKVAGWFAIASVGTLLVWQATISESFWVTIVCCLILAALCTLLGIRIGTHSTSAYINDVNRLNKALAEQNTQLEDANAALLRRLQDGQFEQ